MADVNDLVLIYFEDKPLSFARIEEILPDAKPDWFHVKLLMLQIPPQYVTWILRDVYIGGAVFTMNEKRMRLEKVVVPEEPFVGRFVARGFGQTKIRARSRGKEAFADVTVTGDRFVRVSDTFEGGPSDFAITLTILAATSEGSLEYRVYEQGQAAAAQWVPARAEGEFQRVTLQTPRLPYRERGSLYNLVIEARDASGVAQQYPITFRLKSTIERADEPTPE